MDSLNVRIVYCLLHLQFLFDVVLHFDKFNSIFILQNILKAYLQGVWDSVKGVSLIFIVARDTYIHSNKLKETEQLKLNYNETSAKGDLDDSSTSLNNTQVGPRTSRRTGTKTTKREHSKLEEYVFWQFIRFIELVK